MTKILEKRRGFLIAAGVILGITGFAKLFTVTGETTLLAVSDPIFGMPFGTLMVIVGLVELVIAGFCLFSSLNTLSTLMVAWIASVFLAYRMGLRVVDWQRPCGCLGNLTDVLGMSPQAAEWLSVGLLGFLLIGSYTFLFLGYKGGGIKAADEPTPTGRA